ncbi:hypothetical protein F0L74_24800 [Chitinophaga agrisoli]|uniref:Uncharacterized protein n=1 Tax=Chitinophaga agrisoli TaxID=2607653 RepID=A0A5B2VKB0_9BACT|nr:hypothetical protein [Chitinophaga agrisoli]KAA2239425.1 hypothetical protein F0L74_24800 [Chitinophaga agrisoli]
MPIAPHTAFELHLTIHDLPAHATAAFASRCAQLDAKPMLIELARGQYIHQPMLNKVIYASSLQVAVATAETLSRSLQANNFHLKRLKIEIPAFDADGWTDIQPGFTPYFEWHGKVSFTNTAALLALCTAHQVHLSLNALKKEAGTRFVTLREFASRQVFEARLQLLATKLEQGGWPILKQQAEYCIYDNNIILDNGWLS